MSEPPSGRMPASHRVSWSVRALDDLNEIEAHVAADAPRAAFRLRLRLVAAADSLKHHPDRGTRVRGQLRKLLVTSPFVIRYVVEADEVTILSIRDDRRRQRR